MRNLIAVTAAHAKLHSVLLTGGILHALKSTEAETAKRGNANGYFMCTGAVMYIRCKLAVVLTRLATKPARFKWSVSLGLKTFKPCFEIIDRGTHIYVCV